MGQVNYKDKYLQLKQRFQESVDVAFRLGFEQGTMAAQQQQMQQQQQQMADQQAQEAQMAAQGMGGESGQDPGQSGQESGQPGAQIQDDSRGVGQQAMGADGNSPQPGMGGSELDQHIGQLEGLMAKSEYGTEQWETLKKSLEGLKSIKVTLDLKKNEQLIKSIGANLKKPLVFSGRAKHNLSAPAKAAVNMQYKIVNELMDTWEAEEKGLPTEIQKILQGEGLSKKE